MRLPALTLLAFFTAARAADLPSSETQTLMKNLQEHRAKFPSLTADFAEEKTTHLLTKPLLSEGVISFQVPNKFRREVKGSSPSLTVSDGAKLWIYYPAFKEAELYTLGQRQFFDDSIAALTAGLNFQHVEQFYTFTAAREADGYRLALTTRSPLGRVASVRWILKSLSTKTASSLTMRRMPLLRGVRARR